jgi:hypothetical protein
MGYRSTLTGATVLAAAILSGPLQAAPPVLHPAASSAISADSLARNIAGAARSAETAHKGPAGSRQGEVEAAVQNLIATVAPSPAVVKTALERVLANCAPKTGAEKDGMLCPTEGTSFVALGNLFGYCYRVTQGFRGRCIESGSIAV